LRARPVARPCCSLACGSPCPASEPPLPALVPSHYPPPLHRFLDDQGYYVSHVGYKGPFLASSNLQAKKRVDLGGVNLFCVKKELHDAVVKAYGAWPQKGASGGTRVRRLQTEGGAAAAGAWARWLEAHAGPLLGRP
jgi:hypothetical protein